MKYILIFAASLLPSLSYSQEEGNEAEKSRWCHAYGHVASVGAEARDDGIPIAEAITSYRAMEKNEDIRAFSEGALIKVYSTNLSPNDAYITARSACEKVHESWRSDKTKGPDSKGLTRSRPTFQAAPEPRP